MNSALEKYTKQAYNQILIEIVKNNDTKALLELLNTHEIDLETKSWDDRTALIIACKEGYTEIVDILLKVGANKEAKDVQHRTGLMYASEAKRVNIVKLLLQAGAERYFSI